MQINEIKNKTKAVMLANMNWFHFHEVRKFPSIAEKNKTKQKQPTTPNQTPVPSMPVLFPHI